MSSHGKRITPHKHNIVDLDLVNLFSLNQYASAFRGNKVCRGHRLRLRFSHKIFFRFSQKPSKCSLSSFYRYWFRWHLQA
ncbi:hypothetical protein RRG08_034413 [Elysia crispata]|uniref:Uncharacterized protein n=1 Tax=Elysia crispata TaxID=231223 RepID=A0AAE0YCX2_9GAST|nr:hypothetical protein RRG08_034413 [Elysia crispata]